MTEAITSQAVETSSCAAPLQIEWADTLENNEISDVNAMILEAMFPSLTDEEVAEWDSFATATTERAKTRTDLKWIYNKAA